MVNISFSAIAGTVLMGAAVGIFYFAGLYWTVRRLPRVKSVGLWLMGSFFIRSAICLTAFYVIMTDDWRRLMGALAGFLLVRIISVRWSKKLPVVHPV